jgi:hypothetical protein
MRVFPQLKDKSYREYAALAGGVLLIGLVLRCYHIGMPPIDFLAWRETQTLMVARNFCREGMNLLRPSVDWRTTYEVAPRGTVGGTELQVVPYLTAVLYQVLGMRYWVGRVVPICFASLATWFFLRLAKRFYGSACAAMGTAFLIVSPYFLYCGRCQMPESFALAMSFAAVYYFDDWLSEGRWLRFSRAAAFTLMMLLGKPQMGVMVVPMAFLAFSRFGWKTFISWRLHLFAVAVGLPFITYMWWTFHVLIKETGISFSGPGFFDYGRWLTSWPYYSSVAKSIWLWSVTPPMCVLGLVGLLVPGGDTRKYLTHLWLLGAVSLFFLMPGGTAPNGYYQIILEPPFALLAARTLTVPCSRRALRVAGGAIFVVALVWPFHVTARLYEPRYLSDYQCGEWVKRNTPETTLLVTSSPNPATLYFSDRVGWTAWQEYYGKGAVFSRRLLNKVIPLGASVLAVPVSQDYFDNAYYREYRPIRDYLYENYLSYKQDSFAIFFLARHADLSLPEDGRIAFGTLESRKYLRGSWGPNQEDAVRAPFVTLGPEKAASIRFLVGADVHGLALEIASAVAEQTITVELDDELAGTATLPISGKRAELRLESPNLKGEGTVHRVTIEATRWNRDGVSVILFSLRELS